MIVKVCGMRDAENIHAVEALGIDLMGFIFYEKSPRFCAQLPAYLPSRCKKIGVFVNASAEEIMEKMTAFQLDVIQLHGDESPEFCKRIITEFYPKFSRKSFGSDSVNSVTTPKLIKVIPISSSEDLKKAEPYKGLVDYFLFETKCSTYGGSGQQFDWSLLNNYKGDTPFLLTGGIGPDDSDRIKAFRHPRFAGIDLNSRFETAPGLKDAQALKRFIDLIRE